MTTTIAPKSIYPCKGFTIFVSPSEYAPFGHPQWKENRATPLSWGYRIDKIPGKCGISRGEGYATQETAETAAAERIESWN